MPPSANRRASADRAPRSAAVSAYVAVGSNIDPERNVGLALTALAQQVKVTGVSTFYRTAPLGDRAQPRFVNGVWRIETAIAPRRLKDDVLRGIEAAVGRVRSADPDAPREIDLDLVLYGELVIDEPGLTLPDPEILERPFVALPLLELEPGLVLPGGGAALAAAAVVNRTTELEPLPALTARLEERVNR
jgi:2-amino-4-hydroxy-6-hydroxymethyldihydropteridine diphosphokinase